MLRREKRVRYINRYAVRGAHDGSSTTKCVPNEQRKIQTPYAGMMPQIKWRKKYKSFISLVVLPTSKHARTSSTSSGTYQETYISTRIIVQTLEPDSKLLKVICYPIASWERHSMSTSQVNVSAQELRAFQDRGTNTIPQPNRRNLQIELNIHEKCISQEHEVHLCNSRIRPGTTGISNVISKSRREHAWGHHVQIDDCVRSMWITGYMQ